MKLSKSINILFFVFILNCTNNNTESTSKENFDETIKNGLSETKVIDVNVLEITEFFETGASQSMAWGNDHLIITDFNENQLLLLSLNGDLIHKTGKYGKGPGEFESISQLYRGPDETLYVLDLLLRRINKYKVSNQNLEYLTTFIPEPEEHYYLMDVYATENGNYAVFNHVLDYQQTGENVNYLYLMDEDFQPVKKILELPGENKTQMDIGFFIQHPLPNKMLWTLENGFFYTLNSHSTTIRKRNMLTGETEEFKYMPDYIRINTRATTDFFLERLDPIIKVVPKAYDAIVESETLPLNQSLLVQGNWIIIKTIYAGGESGTIIFVNQNSGKAYYGNVPPHFSAFSMIDNSLIGIDFTDLDNVQVKRITFDPDAFDTF